MSLPSEKVEEPHAPVSTIKNTKATKLNGSGKNPGLPLSFAINRNVRPAMTLPSAVAGKTTKHLKYRGKAPEISRVAGSKDDPGKMSNFSSCTGISPSTATVLRTCFTLGGRIDGPPTGFQPASSVRLRTTSGKTQRPWGKCRSGTAKTGRYAGDMVSLAGDDSKNDGGSTALLATHPLRVT
jgi:hypothetical protein